MNKKARILVVDDDLHLLHAASRTLKKAGYEVIEAKTGGECLRLVEEREPDLVLLDVVLPDVGGLEICRRIKRGLYRPGCFVLMLSGAKTSPDDQADGLEAGADGYITRPISNREFLARIAAVLRIKKAEESVEHLNRVLRAINNVNQLIAREKDRDRMLQGACDLLIETRGYHNAWIALFDESGAYSMAFEAGLGENFSPLHECLKRGELTACGRRALAQLDVVVTQNPFTTCLDCPLADNYAGRGAMTARLAQSGNGKVYGLLTVSIRADLAMLEDEQILLREVAADIAFALQAIEAKAEQKRVEEALWRSEERLQLALKGANLGMWDWNIQTGDVVFNERWAAMLGYRLDEIEPHVRTWEKLIHPADLPGVMEALNAHLEGKTDFYETEHRMRAKDGNWKWILDRGQVMAWDERGQPLRAAGTHLDVTERKRAEEALLKSEAFHRAIVSCSPVAIYSINLDGIVLSWNASAERIFGWSTEEVIGEALPIVPLDKQEEFATLRERLVDGHRFSGLEIVRRKKDGSLFPASLSAASIYDGEGEIIGILGILEDITERKQAQRQIEAALREKEVMLKEIHHRVKNNLAIVAGLLEFQAETVENEAARNAFLESQNRIYTMAHIHEHLYRSPDLSRIDMADYICSLTNYLQQSYGAYHVDLDVGVPDISMTVDMAIPCGLIVNELVSNAMQHAFPSDQHELGQHRISVKMSESNDQLTLKVSDNGIGLPPNFVQEDLSSLGVKLTDMLVKQIGGDMVWRTEDGATFIITFPNRRA